MSKELWESLREIEIIAEMREEVYLDIPSQSTKKKTTKQKKK